MSSIIVLIVIYAEYRLLVHYAECRYAECRGALNEGVIKLETLANSEICQLHLIELAID